MVSRVKKHPGPVHAVLCGWFVLFSVRGAGANPIFVSTHQSGGWWLFIPVVLFAVSLETAVFAFITGISWRRLAGIIVSANVFSALAGAPVVLFGNSWERPDPWDYGSGSLAFTGPGWGEIALLFMLALMAEGLLILCWHRRWPLAAPLRRIALALLIANVSTYAVLVPVIRYYETPARHSFPKQSMD